MKVGRWLWPPEARPVSFVNGTVATAHGIAHAVRVTSHVLAIDEPPQHGDAVVDLAGGVVLPGLVNAHDHLELNHYGPLKGSAAYAHADEWIADLRPRLQQDEHIRRNAVFPLADRLFIGGLKNLLAGVTTVAHHNPRYRALARGCPVRVLEQYGWAHSYSMQGQPVGAGGEPGPDVRRACEATPASAAFFVHVGEGIDRRATRELQRFEADGCFRPNSVIVHGVGHTLDTWRSAVAAGSSLVWCPASNQFLFGRTVDVAALTAAVSDSATLVCLGSDSRLTGSRDLLEELRCARALGVPSTALLAMVTVTAGRILRHATAGRLTIGGPADLVVLPPGEPEGRCPQRPPGQTDAAGLAVADALLAARRRDVQCVMLGGVPLLAAPAYAHVFAARQRTTRDAVVDGEVRLFDSRLARRLAQCAIEEPGVRLVQV